MTTAHETSTAFSEEVVKENEIFELSKKQEMKELLQTYADGQVEMLQRVSCARPKDCRPDTDDGRQWTTGTESSRFCNESG